jgi:hypothetical protein
MKSRTADVPFFPPLNPRISAAEYQAALGAKPKRKHKYGVAPVEQRTVDGIVFDSAAEAKRYGQLKLLEKGGYIRRLTLQPVWRFCIGEKMIFRYIADFSYVEPGRGTVVEDVKGVKTPVYRLKKRLIEAQFGIKITEIL